MKTETIILSIHPQHIEKIFSGEKRYEYRKRIPMNIRYIVVYATAPIKMIVAVIEIESIIKGTPDIVWSRTKNHAGISKDFFMNYFMNHKDSYAIMFKTILKLETPKSLMCLGKNLGAPQSYTYLKETPEELCNKLGLNQI